MFQRLTYPASVVLSFAETNDNDAVRRMLYSLRGLSKDKMVLVELPKILYAGFSHILKRLQEMACSEDDIAFLPLIAPSSASSSPEVSPPKYSVATDFVYKMDCLRANGTNFGEPPLTLKSTELHHDLEVREKWVDTICLETTLDRGQATAMCENLCRGLAFTLGRFFRSTSCSNGHTAYPPAELAA